MLFIIAMKYSKHFGFNKDVKLDRHLTRTITPSLNLSKLRFPFHRPIHQCGSLVNHQCFFTVPATGNGKCNTTHSSNFLF